jgi:hypothetical protein
MSNRAAIHLASKDGLQQPYALLLLGVIFLLGALLLHPDPFTYPVGVLCLGLGMSIAAFFQPRRLIIASSLLVPLGLAVFLTFKSLLPGKQIFPVYIVALGLGLLAIAFFTRRGSIGRGAVSPALIVIAVGVIEMLLAAGLTPAGFIPFMLSLWLPGGGLLILGLAGLLRSVTPATKA